MGELVLNAPSEVFKSVILLDDGTDGIFRGYNCSQSKVMSIQAGWDIMFDVHFIRIGVFCLDSAAFLGKGRVMPV